MLNSFRLRKRLGDPAPNRLDRYLFVACAYCLPVVLALISMYTLVVWESDYVTTEARKTEFRMLVETGSALTPRQAFVRLAQTPPVQQHDTHLSEQPIWFSLVPAATADGTAPVLEFPSRHAMQMSCWDADSATMLGRSDHAKSEGAMTEIRAGFALALQPSSIGRPLICQARFVGPARLTVLEWPASQLQIAAQEFHRNSGLLDGGLLVLAVFILIAALINRNSTYVLFSSWLIINLRMGALSAGWDTQWLGHALPAQWMTQIRQLTMTFYYILTVTLFFSLFRDVLRQVGHPRLIRATQWSCLALLALSVALPYRTFLPLIWTASGVSMCVLAYFLVRILRATRSPVAIWYAASISLTLAASLYEILSAALGYKALIGTVNSVSAALSSSLLAALAIAHQMRIEHQQRLEAQAELEHTFHAMPIGLFTLDVRGNFLSANPALHAMVGADVMAAGRNSWAQHFHAGSWEQLHDLVHTESDSELQIQRSGLAGSENAQSFMVKATLARGKIEGSLHDVTQQLRATEDLRFMANNDPLTKVFNRRGIEQMLGKAVARLADGRPLALAYLDLDRFKLINDLYGHAIGDEVLKQVCDRVSGMLTGGHCIGRLGGDEFVVVMPDTTMPLASWICRGIVNSISSTSFTIGDKAFQVRGSVGLIEVSAGTMIRDALATADRACRLAKNGHHDSLVIYEKNAPAFREREAELDLVERLSGGVAPAGLFVEMQPIMSLKSPRDSLNFEVLLRMRDRDGSLIPTHRVISAAENSGRISVIDRWVLSTTLSWLDQHQAALPNTQFVCMNLSGASLNDERFIQDAFDMLSRNLGAASRLCIEITESVALHDLDNTRRFIDKVRGYGVKVALDDFGAGYTSFSYLRELPADILKIDGSFIVDMNAHPANIAIVEAIVSLAMNLGMKTIAEWAEDSATVQTLTEVGVDYVQGYVVAYPRPPADILAATSSAGFIEDAGLAQFVAAINPPLGALAAAGLPATMRLEDLH